MRSFLILLTITLVVGGCGKQTIIGDDDGSTDTTSDSHISDVTGDDVANEDCVPGIPTCVGEYVMDCDEIVEWCDPGRAEICEEAACVSSCDIASTLGTNLGCEFMAADLDNANISSTLDASAQQFAVVAMNPGRTSVTVTVERNDGGFGEAPNIVTVMEVDVSARTERPLLLDTREVDGGSPVWPHDGTGTALTSRAYRITSTGPIALYQFNPFQNEDVFSNDATLLLPRSALGTEYEVIGWPQTIAETPGNPGTDMGNDLRAFLTIVGVEEATDVTVILPSTPGLSVLGDGDTIPELGAGDSLEVTLGPFDVLNLETDGFMSDFTGTIVDASSVVVVFSGAEASDVPTWETLADRACCADHLEQQLLPAPSAGSTYVTAMFPPRSEIVRSAGGTVTVIEEPVVFRIMALADVTTVTTTLPAPDDSFLLHKGQFRTLESTHDFHIEADHPVSVAQFMVSQQVAGIPNELPGGDTSFILLPSIDQWQRSHVFLVPQMYAFDLIAITHPTSAELSLDGAPPGDDCSTTVVAGTDDEFAVTTCQLSLPEIDEDLDPPENVIDGVQGDGVHILGADVPVGVVAFGFDNFVSYGYAAGLAGL